jgi:hypothetical protein
MSKKNKEIVETMKVAFGQYKVFDFGTEKSYETIVGQERLSKIWATTKGDGMMNILNSIYAMPLNKCDNPDDIRQLCESTGQLVRAWLHSRSKHVFDHEDIDAVREQWDTLSEILQSAFRDSENWLTLEDNTSESTQSREAWEFLKDTLKVKPELFQVAAWLPVPKKEAPKSQMTTKTVNLEGYRPPTQITVIEANTLRKYEGELRHVRQYKDLTEFDRETVLPAYFADITAAQLTPPEAYVTTPRAEWPDTVWFTAVRQMLGFTQMSSGDEYQDALQALREYNRPGIAADNQEANQQWHLSIAKAMHNFDESVRKDLNESKNWRLIRDWISKELGKSHFGSYVLDQLQVSIGKDQPAAWQTWFEAYLKHYNSAQQALTLADSIRKYATKSAKPADNTRSDGDRDQSRSKRKRGDRQNTEPKAPERKPPPKLDKLCHFCGRNNHLASACRLRDHPNANKNPKLKWLDSPEAKSVLLTDSTIKELPYKFGTPQPKKGDNTKGTTINALHNDSVHTMRGSEVIFVLHPHESVLTDDNTNTITPTPIRVNGLLDTGSLGAQLDSYISPEVADQVCQKLGYTRESIVDKICVSSAFNELHNVTDVVSVKCSIDAHNMLGANDVVTLRLGILNMPYDLIVGYNTIRTQGVLRDTLCRNLGVDSRLNTSHTALRISGTKKEKDLDDDTERTGSHDPNLNVVHASACKSSDSRTHPDGTRGYTRAKYSNRYNRARARQCRWRQRRTLNTLHSGSNIPRELMASSPEKLQNLRKVCERYKTGFRRELDQQTAFIEPMEIILKGNSIWGCRASALPARLQSRLKADEIVRQVDKMLAAGVIRLSKASAHSQVMLTPKKDNKWRFCIDYRRLNQSTNASTWPLPRIKEMLQRVGRKRPKRFGILDLTKGYYQAPLSEGSKHLTAFITPNGCYEWNRVAMGLTGAPSYFQKAMATEVLQGLLYNICEVYLDDILVYGDTEDEFHANLETVLQRLQERNIHINPDKCRLGMTEVEYVGHVISEDGISFSREKLQHVLEVKKPLKQRDLKSFLGLCNYFREHVEHHSSLAYPLDKMLVPYTPNAVLKWSEEQTKAFTDLQRAVNEAPKLFFEDDSPVHLYTDASLTGIGAYLCQKRNGKEVPIAFYSKRVKDEERKWGIPCLEAYAIWQAFKHFDYLLRDAKTWVHTDHKNLVYIREHGSEKIIRWKMDLLEYNFELDAIPGVDNPIADFMSRNEGAPVHECEVDNARQATHILSCLNTVDNEEENEEVTARINRLTSTHGTACLNLLDGMAIPPEAYEAIALVHNEGVGHHGVEATLDKLASQEKRWPYMRSHVQRYVRECDTCQKRALGRYDVKAPHFNVGKYNLMECIGLDIIGPFKESKNGNRYVLVMIDAFSRFVMCRAIPDTKALTVATAYLDHMGIFGVPYEVKTDGGSEFVNAIFDHILKLSGSRKITTVAYSHEENGIVERANQEIGKWIGDMIYDHRESLNAWEEALPFATRIHNASPISTILHSPAQLVFGSNAVLDKNILLPRKNRTPLEDDAHTYLKDRVALQDLMIKRAQNRSKTLHQSHKQKSPTEITTYKHGDFVLLAYPESSVWKRRRPHKLGMMYTGPYKVIKKGKDNTYLLENLVTKERKEKLVFHLRPYHFDPTRTNPQDMAMKDHQGEFYVERIVGHTGKFTKPSGLRFSVKWLLYPEIEHGQLWKDLKNVDKMAEYLTEIGKEQYIPPKDDSDDDSTADIEYERAAEQHQEEFDDFIAHKRRKTAT